MIVDARRYRWFPDDVAVPAGWVMAKRSIRNDNFYTGPGGYYLFSRRKFVMDVLSVPLVAAIIFSLALLGLGFAAGSLAHL